MRDFHAAREAKRRRSKCAPRRGYLLSDARLLPALCFFVPRATKFQRAIKPTGGAGEGTEGCAPPSNPFVATKAANLRRTRRHQLVHTGRCSKGPPTMRGNLAARNGKYERDKEREREGERPSSSGKYSSGGELSRYFSPENRKHPSGGVQSFKESRDRGWWMHKMREQASPVD